MAKKYPNNLKRLRLKSGMTQMEVVRVLGLKSNNSLSRWENGLALPNILNTNKLCKLYNIDFKDLLS